EPCGSAAVAAPVKVSSSAIAARRPPSILELGAEMLVAAAAAVLAQIGKGGLDFGLASTLDRGEERVGLGRRILLGSEEFVPLAPDLALWREFAVGAFRARSGWEEIRDFPSRTGQMGGGGRRCGLVALAGKISFDTAEVLSLLLHHGGSVLDHLTAVHRRCH